MRNKRLINKVNLTIVYVVSAIILVMGISYAHFYDYKNLYDTYGGMPTMSLYAAGNNAGTTTAANEIKRTMAPMSDEEARVGDLFSYNRTDRKFSEGGMYLYLNENEAYIDIDLKNETGKDTYYGILVKYRDFDKSFTAFNNSFSTSRIKDNFIKFDVKEYDLNFKTGMYEVNYLTKGQSFDNLNGTNIGYFKVANGEKIHKTITINTWITDDIRICNDGSCDYTSTKFSKLKSDLMFSLAEFDYVDYNERVETDFFNTDLKSRYTTAYPSNTDIDYVEEIDFKKMPLNNILNRYNDADYKVMIDSNTYSWYEKLEDGSFYKCIVASDKTLVPSDNIVSRSMFYNYGYLSLIDIGKDILDTSNMTKFASIFYNCYYLQRIKGFEYLDFSSVTDMFHLFYNCYSLMHIDFGGEINNLRDADQMFFNCISLSVLDLTMFDLSKVHSSSEMFYNCANLVQIYADTNFDLTSTSTPFKNCFSLIGNIPFDSSYQSASYGNYETGYFLKPAELDKDVIYKSFSNSFWYDLNSLVSNSSIRKVIITSLDNCDELYQAAVDAGKTAFYADGRQVKVWVAANTTDTVFISSDTGYIKILNTYFKPSVNSNITHFVAYRTQFDSLENSFKDMNALKALDLGYANTSMVTSYRYAFCNTVATINTYDLDTDYATDLSYMFAHRALRTYHVAAPFSGSYGSSTYLNINNFNTTRVTSIEGMFSNITLDSNLAPRAIERYNGINGSSIENMKFLFSGHYDPYYNVIIPRIGLKNVKYLNGMFLDFAQVEGRSLKLDVSAIDFNSNPTLERSFEAFMYGVLFDVIDISGFNSSYYVANPFGFDEVFNIGFKKLIAHNCDFSGLTSRIDQDYMKSMYFSKFYSLNNATTEEDILMMSEIFDIITEGYAETLKLKVNFDSYSSFIIPNQIIYDYIEFMDFSNSKFANSMCGLFYGLNNLSYLNLYNVDTYSVTDMSSLFFGDTKLMSMDLSSFKYNNCRSTSGMFALTMILNTNIKNLNTTYKLEDMSYMFAASGLLCDTIYEMNTDNVIDMRGAFFACMYYALVPQFCTGRNTSNVLYFDYMFASVSDNELYLDSFDTRKGISFDYMFAGCSNLQYIYVSEKFVNNSGTEPVGPFDRSENIVGGYYDETEGQYYEFYSYDYMDYDTYEVTEDLFYIAGDHMGLLTFDGIMIENFYDNFTNESSSGYQEAFRTGIREIVIEPLSDMEYMDHYMEDSIGTSGSISFVLEDDVMHIHYNQTYSDKIYLPGDSSEFFKDMTALEKIIGWEYINAYMVTDCSQMFAGCTSLVDLDIEDLDLSSATNMADMFNGCTSLRHARIGGIKTYAVTNMDQMFYGCSNLIYLDISGFVTPNLTSMVSTFQNCTRLKMIFAGDGWTNASVAANADTFRGVGGLLSMNDDGDFFYIDMLYYASRYARKSDGTNFGLFSDKHNYMVTPWFFVEELSSINKGAFTTIYLEDKFQNYSSVYDISLAGDNSVRLYIDGATMYICAETKTYFPVDCSMFFGSFTNLTTVRWNSKNISSQYSNNFNSMFYNDSLLTSIDFIEKFDTRNCIDFDYMFYGCKLDSNLSLSNFDVSKAQSFKYMFYGCTGIYNVRLTGWHFENNVNMDQMFYGCSNLNILYAGLDWNGDKIVSAVGALDGVGSSFQSPPASTIYLSLADIISHYGLTRNGQGFIDYAVAMNVTDYYGALTSDTYVDGYSFR